MANNRPRYLQYGDVFMPSKQQVYKEEEIQKYRQRANNYNIRARSYNNTNDEREQRDHGANASYQQFRNVDTYTASNQQFDSEMYGSQFNEEEAQFYSNDCKRHDVNYYGQDIDDAKQQDDFRGINSSQLGEGSQFINRNSTNFSNNDQFVPACRFTKGNNMYPPNTFNGYDRAQNGYTRASINDPNGCINTYNGGNLQPQSRQLNNPTLQYAPRKYFKSIIFQKFIITFTSLLSIVCLVWIAYSWTRNRHCQPPVIESEKSLFKVLPDENETVHYQDKAIYNRIDNRIPIQQQEVGIQPQEAPFAPPNEKKQIVEYSIVEDREYYVKCAIDQDAEIAKSQLNTLRKKLTTFPDSDMLENVTCSIKTVANVSGQKGSFILIGPFKEDNIAQEIGHFCKVKGEIISVKKNK